MGLTAPTVRLTAEDRDAGALKPVAAAPPATGCRMSNSLYVKANGDMPCWDDAGEELTLRAIDEAELRSGKGESLFNSEALKHIRSSFLAGTDPHPDFCSRCAVRGQGRTTDVERTSMRILHIEPCYLCQLACPLCFTPKERLGLKGAPYYMDFSFYEALLRRLRSEGVRDIQVVHFEGRGDPLLNRELGEMVRLTKELYPRSFVQITTHGNYKFKPWMLDAGVDLLRLSVDGAFQESYETYRVNGQLDKVLGLMRDLRDARATIPSSTRVVWKYILFEWNDSDREIREAARLAAEMGVDLSFCLTHTPGRSQRFATDEALVEALRLLAPSAKTERTYPMRPPKQAPTFFTRVVNKSRRVARGLPLVGSAGR